MRLFVAVWPPEAVLDGLEALPRPALPGVRWTRRDQWHVTLRFLGGVDEEEARGAFAATVVPARAPELSAGPATSALGRRVLQVPVAGLEELAGAVADATGAVGKSPRPGPFVGHLTLARCERPAALRQLAGEPFAAAWTAREVTLVSSVPGRGGSRYAVVARLPLGPGA